MALNAPYNYRNVPLHRGSGSVLLNLPHLNTSPLAIRQEIVAAHGAACHVRAWMEQSAVQPQNVSNAATKRSKSTPLMKRVNSGLKHSRCCSKFSSSRKVK